MDNLCRNLLPALLQGNFVTMQLRSGGGPLGRSYPTYCVAPLGLIFLENTTATLILTVPESVREDERLAEEKRQKILSRLTSAGVDLSKIPEAELKMGEGEVMNAYTHLYNYVDNLRQRDPAKANALLALKDDIARWRATTAQTLIMAPASVLPEHLMCKVAYVGSRGPLSAKALEDIGLRLPESSIKALSEVTMNWCLKNDVGGIGDCGSSSSSSSTSKEDRMINLTSFLGKPWKLAYYVTGRAWEISAERFAKGEELQSIACNQPLNKNGTKKNPVQPNTIAGHLLDALCYGRHPVDLARLAAGFPPPTRQEWDAVAKGEVEAGIDVTDIDDKNINKIHILQGACPAMLVPFTSRDEADKASVQHWTRCLLWYTSLRRACYQPIFASSSPYKRGVDAAVPDETNKKQRI